MKCSATNRNGKKCGRNAIEGGTVCNMHGGSAPQVRRRAALRMLAMADYALDALWKDMKDKGERRIRQVAYLSLLDRVGLKAAERFMIEEPEHATGFDADLSQLTNEELAEVRRMAQKVARQS
jgi:hypothetical protein